MGGETWVISGYLTFHKVEVMAGYGRRSCTDRQT